VAVERGPLVYCVEAADAPERAEIEELAWDPSRDLTSVPRPDIAPAMIGVDVPVTGGESAGAIPYFAWANRGVGGMRVWIPR
jgi:DUF1680 family protein